MLWDKLNCDRFLELKSLDMVERSPGSFMLDKKAKKLYVHPLQSVHPDTVGIVIVPWFANGRAMPVNYNTIQTKKELSQIDYKSADSSYAYLRSLENRFFKHFKLFSHRGFFILV